MTIVKSFEDVLVLLQQFGQQHLLTFWDELSENDRNRLLHDICEIDFEKFIRDVEEAKDRAAREKISKVDHILQPPTTDVCGSWATTSPEVLEQYATAGLKCISEGEYCAILLAGGAGTRLGVSYPKGMYDIGLPSGKSLFQIQAERIIRLQVLAKEKFGKCSPIMWYVMTSDCTRDATMEYFVKHQYFGLDVNQIEFFEQFTLPAIGDDGKIILESKCRILKSPDGNGGLYRSLRKYDLINHMKTRGIRYAFVYGVDNILVKIVDPVFLGFVIEKDAECAAKVVEKTEPGEAVGIVGKVNGRYQVVEYSEIAPETAEKLDPQDERKLLYRSASICMHLLRIDFLERVCQVDISEHMIQHIALKKVPYFNIESGKVEKSDKINCIKLEKFVFDVFPYAEKFAIWEVDRTREFSPLKNSIGSRTDSPESVKSALLKYSKMLVMENIRDPETKEKAKGMTIEISPLLSYSGEGLQSIEEKVNAVDGKQYVHFEKVDNAIQTTLQ